MPEQCYYCYITPYNQTLNIAIQVFNGGAISSISLSPYGVDILQAETWNIPDKGATHYTVSTRINYCPMCGRFLKNKLEDKEV